MIGGFIGHAIGAPIPDDLYGQASFSFAGSGATSFAPNVFAIASFEADGSGTLNINVNALASSNYIDGGNGAASWTFFFVGLAANQTTGAATSSGTMVSVFSLSAAETLLSPSQSATVKVIDKLSASQTLRSPSQTAFLSPDRQTAIFEVMALASPVSGGNVHVSPMVWDRLKRKTDTRNYQVYHDNLQRTRNDPRVSKLIPGGQN